MATQDCMKCGTMCGDGQPHECIRPETNYFQYLVRQNMQMNQNEAPVSIEDEIRGLVAELSESGVSNPRMQRLMRHINQNDSPTIAPGVHGDLSFEDYLRIDAVSNTSMGMMKQSPLHYHQRVGLEQSKALRIGSLVHTGQLEPDALAERYAVMPDYHLDADNKTEKGNVTNSKNTKYVKDKVAEFETEYSHKEIVPREWYDEMLAMVSSIASNRLASHILKCKQYELTLVWEDSKTGLLCKARLDAVEPGSRIVDLKTTADISKFTKAIANYGYHRQMAHYQAGWKALTGNELPTYIVPVEKQKPYCVMAAALDEEALIAGREERNTLLKKIAECNISNNWPGPESPSVWRLPEWAMATEPVEISFGGKKVSI